MTGTSTSRPHGTLTLGIAGLAVQVQGLTPALHTALVDRYRAFLVPESSPECTVRITLAGRTVPALPEKIPYFREAQVLFTHPSYQGQIDLPAGWALLTLDSTRPVEDIDYFLRVIYALLVFRAGGLLFHAAGIVRDERAFLFFGYSGSGKTTVARLSPDAVVLNDDLLVLLPDGGRWRAYGTPFWNPTQVQPKTASAPIARMLSLVQSTDVRLEPLSLAQALAEVVASVPVISASPAHSTALLLRCQLLLAAIPVAALHFRKNASFWEML